MKTVSRNNLQLGEDLFHKVAEIETVFTCVHKLRVGAISLYLCSWSGPFTPPIFRPEHYYSRVATAQGKQNLAPFSRQGKHREFSLF